jgi:hypoxanthine phosphoribosyltransferase
MLNKIKQVSASAELIYSETQVEAALDDMATAISSALANSNPLVLCVLNGGIVVMGKLLTRLAFPLNIDAINATRYQNQTSGGTVRWLVKPETPLTNRTVLVVDDILDEGITLAEIKDYCLGRGAEAVYTAVLLDKDLGKVKPIHADFVGLTVENRYLFGYGMDYKGYLRNAAGIFACKEENT